jgi:hypothetical protein
MKAKNTGEKIIIEGDFYEVSTLAVMLDNYIKDNPDHEDIELAKEWLHELRNPKVN